MKRIFIFFVLAVLFLIKNRTIAQTWTDVQYAGSNYDDSGNGICTDTLGNTFVTGSFADSVYFGGVKVKATGNTKDVFVVKYNASMNVVWAKRYGGASHDDSFAIKTDANGNIYIAGTFGVSITFDTITLNNPAGHGIFIVKLNPNGTAIWAKSATASGSDFHPSGLGLDINNNIYISGYYAGTADFGNAITLSSIVHPLNLTPSVDIFTAKFNSSGICQWARTGGSYQTDRSLGIAVTPGGNAYITGFYGEDATFNGSSLIYNGGGVDLFIAGYSTTGTLILLTAAVSNDYEAGYAITVDALTNIFITGLSSGPTLFDTITVTPHGSYDMFIAKYNASGHILWATNTIGSQWEDGSAIGVDAGGNVYIGGHIYHGGTSSFPGIYFTSKGYYDAYVAKYNQAGEFQWAQRGGSYKYDYVRGLALSDSGKVIITGAYEDTARFSNFALPHTGSPGLTDYFIARVRSDINTSLVNGFPKCPGSAVTVPFKTNIPFNPGNVFTAQLSDSKGRFANAINIGTLAGTGSGSISATIPANTAGGNGYRIRVISSDSARTGGDNGINLTIWAPPVAVITSGGTDFCSGDSLQIISTSGAGYSWQWKKNGNDITGATSSVYFAKTSGDYKVKITESSHGCTAVSNTIHATMRNQPNAVITPASATTFCAGGSVLLNANTGTGFFYQWKKNNGNISGATGNSYSATGSGKYTVKVTNSYGCTKISSGVTVTVNPNPVASYTGLSASYDVNAAPAALTPTPAGGIFTGPGISGYSFFPSIAGTGGPYHIIYTYTDANGCFDSDSQQTTVTCLVPPVPGTITVSGGNSKVCPGDSRTYTIAAVSGASSYTWTPPTGGTIGSGQGTVSVVINFTGGFTASDSIKVKANNACGSSAKKSLLIQRNNPATPGTIAGQNTGVCNQSGLIYSVPFVAGITYGWSFVSGASAIVAGGQGTSAITANFNPGYTVDTLRVNANNACGTSSYKKLTVIAAPATPASIAGSTAVCANQQNVPYSISPLVSVTNYTWTGPSGSHISDGVNTSAGATLVTTATSVTVDYGASGGTLKVRGNNSCASGSYRNSTIAIVCRESAFSSGVMDVAVRPNPSTGDFVFELTNLIEDDITVEIYDVLGKMILSENVQQPVFTIRDAALLPGIYLAVIRSVNERKTIRLIKTN